MRFCKCLLLLSAILLPVATVQAAVEYTMIDLRALSGDVEGEIHPYTAGDINNLGQVTGHGYLTQERQTSTVITVLGLTLLTLFTSATAAYFVAGKVIQPLRELGETAGHLGAGDLAVRATVHGGDEIGATASAFNLMADRMGQLLGNLEQQVADRTRDLTRRTGYLEASAEVGRAANSILETDELLRHVVESIRFRILLVENYHFQEQCMLF